MLIPTVLGGFAVSSWTTIALTLYLHLKYCACNKITDYILVQYIGYIIIIISTHYCCIYHNSLRRGEMSNQFLSDLYQNDSSNILQMHQYICNKMNGLDMLL